MAHKKRKGKSRPGKKKPRGHHRRPSSIDGSDHPANLWAAPTRSAAARQIEDKWHVIVINMCAQKISKALAQIMKPRGYHVWHVRTKSPLHNYHCGPSGCAMECVSFELTRARKDAYDDMKVLIAKYTNNPSSDEATFAFINAFLLDPDYTLVLKKMRKKRAAAPT